MESKRILALSTPAAAEAPPAESAVSNLKAKAPAKEAAPAETKSDSKESDPSAVEKVQKKAGAESVATAKADAGEKESPQIKSIRKALAAELIKDENSKEFNPAALDRIKRKLVATASDSDLASLKERFGSGPKQFRAIASELEKEMSRRSREGSRLADYPEFSEETGVSKALAEVKASGVNSVYAYDDPTQPDGTGLMTETDSGPMYLDRTGNWRAYEPNSPVDIRINASKLDITKQWQKSVAKAVKELMK